MMFRGNKYTHAHIRTYAQTHVHTRTHTHTHTHTYTLDLSSVYVGYPYSLARRVRHLPRTIQLVLDPRTIKLVLLPRTIKLVRFLHSLPASLIARISHACM